MPERMIALEPLGLVSAELLGALLAGYLVHFLLWRLLGRFARSTSTIFDDSLARHCRRPTNFVFPTPWPSTSVSPSWRSRWVKTAWLFVSNLLIALLIFSLAWTLTRLTSVAEDVISRPLRRRRQRQPEGARHPHAVRDLAQDQRCGHRRARLGPGAHELRGVPRARHRHPGLRGARRSGDRLRGPEDVGQSPGGDSDRHHPAHSHRRCGHRGGRVGPDRGDCAHLRRGAHLGPASPRAAHRITSSRSPSRIGPAFRPTSWALSSSTWTTRFR